VFSRREPHREVPVSRCCFVAVVVSSVAVAASPVAAQELSASRTSSPSPVYYGGSVGLGFGNGFRIGVFPLVGVRVTPQFSLGAQVGYEYANYNEPDADASNYGGAVFARYRVIPQLYLHGEGRYVNYELFDVADDSTREWVPFILLGGGFVQRVSARTSAYVEVLFDVLQNDRSPYDSWEPSIRVGMAVGF
jgi:hypothetical protein